MNNQTEDNNRSVYSEMVTQMDAGVGKMIATLESEGILDNTIIVFSSDNGGALQLGASNASLNGGKGSSLEGGLRVPGLVWAPGRVAGGGDFKQPITILDWLPTLLDAAGGNPNSVINADGQNMWAALTENKDTKRRGFILGARENTAVFDWPWKLVVLGGTERTPEASYQLFNVIDDPNETADLAEQEPQIFAKLSATLAAMPAAESRRDTSNNGAGSFYTRLENGEWDYDQIIVETRKPWVEAAEKVAQ